MVNMQTLGATTPAAPVIEAKPTDPAAAATKGAVPISEALQGGEGAKINTLALTDISKASQASASGTSVAAGSLLEGKMAVEMVDAILPSALVIGLHAMKIPSKKSDFQLTAKEKDVLAPVVQKCLDSLMINFNNPWAALAFTAGAIYLSKAAEHIGVAMLDRKAAETSPKKQAPVRQMEPVKSASAPTDSNPIQTINNPLRPWDEMDVEKVVKKRKKGREDAIDWLGKNWEKKGGIV